MESKKTISMIEAARNIQNFVSVALNDTKLDGNTIKATVKSDNPELPPINFSMPELFKKDEDSDARIYLPRDVRVAMYQYLNIRLARGFNIDESSDAYYVDEVTHELPDANTLYMLKEDARRRQTVPIFDLLPYLNGIEAMGDGTHDYSSRISATLSSKFEKAFEILDEENQELLKRIESVDVNSKFLFSEVMAFLSSPGKILTWETNEAIKMGMEIVKAELLPGSFFTPPMIRIKGKVITSNGRGLIEGELQETIVSYSGRKSFKELGYVVANFDKKIAEDLAARGRKFIEFTKSPKYLQYEGELFYDTYFGPVKFPATGRIMLDIVGMKQSETNYYKYFGQERYSDDDETNFLEPESLTDLQLMTVSPYAYGYSLRAKRWGRFLVDNSSQISFRTDAYDMLVMDKERKDMIFSLVSTSVGGSKDFIDGKGGGCIFLLEGAPG